MIYIVKKRRPNFPLRKIPWLYLGEDYRYLQEVSKILGPELRLSFASELSAQIRAIRSRFIEWTAELGKPDPHALSWWSTQTASKNILVSPLFLHICYLKIVEKLTTEAAPQSDLLIICEDWFLLASVENLLQQQGIAFTRLGNPQYDRLTAITRNGANWVLRWFGGLTKLLLTILAARITRSTASPTPPVPTPQVVIRTCVEDNCFGADGNFKDRYFPGLNEWCDRNGIATTTIPWLFATKLSKITRFRWLRQHTQKFLIIEDYFRLLDIPAAAWIVLKSGFQMAGQQTFLGLDVTTLIRRERLRNSSSASTIQFLLTATALKRWLSLGNQCRTFIDMFENMPPEKCLIKALREASPETKIIGYAQVSAIPLDLLIYAIQKEEWQRGFFPDLIVTNSSIARQNLIDNGFPNEQILVGPALRHAALLARKQSPRKEPSPKNSILLLLPIELNAAAELTAFGCQLVAQAQQQNLKILVKPHPMVPPARVLNTLGVAELPQGMLWITGALDNYLPDAAIVFGFQSVLLDAAAQATPFLILERELGLSLNPFSAWEEKYAICRSRSAAEILAQFSDLLMWLSSSKIVAEQAALAQCIQTSFGPIDDKHFSAFLGRSEVCEKRASGQ